MLLVIGFLIMLSLFTFVLMAFAIVTWTTWAALNAEKVEWLLRRGWTPPPSWYRQK